MLNADFYRQFVMYDYMLIHHTDALVFSSDINTWLDKGYSYVGAPWLNSEEDFASTGILFKGVGNGGFCLRKIQHVIRVLDSSRKISSFRTHLSTAKFSLNPLRLIWRYIIYVCKVPRYKDSKFMNHLNENKVISSAADRFDFFVIPTPFEAMKFAFEHKPEILYLLNGNKMPLGLHAWEKWGKEFVKDKLDVE